MKETILSKDTIAVTIGDDHSYNCTAVTLGRTGENAISQLEITLPEELCSFWAYLDFKKPEADPVRTPRLPIVNGVVEYDIPSSLLDKNGNLEVQLVLQSENGEIWKSAVKKYVVLKSIDAEGTVSEQQDFFTEAQKMLDEVEEKLAETKHSAEGCANALKGSASGSAIRIADVSPAEHTLKVGVRSKNLFDVSTELEGKWVKPGTGVIGDYSTFNVSDYIAIPPNTTFTINYVRQGAFYDENKVYISDMASGTVTTQRTYTMPANAHYVRFSYQPAAASGDIVQLELGTEVGHYTPFVDVSSVTLLVNGESYHPKPDGTVEGVKSVYPYMALSVEEIGVAIDVEYNRDVNKAYGALLNAITALGGSVENFVEETPVLVPEEEVGLKITIETLNDDVLSNVVLHVDGDEVGRSSDTSDTQTFEYNVIPSSAYLSIETGSEAQIRVGPSSTDYTEEWYTGDRTIDLLSLGYTDIYIGIAY